VYSKFIFEGEHSGSSPDFGLIPLSGTEADAKDTYREDAKSTKNSEMKSCKNSLGLGGSSWVDVTKLFRIGLAGEKRNENVSI